MPIGMVTAEDFEEELRRLNPREPSSNEPLASIESLPKKGRTSDDVATPASLRKIIGETSVIDGRQAALRIAEDFGVSKSSVSAYAKGATSTKTYKEPAKGIIDHINRSRQRAVKRASHTLNAALAAVSQEKLDYADAKDLAGIAKDMSVIIRNLEPPQADVSQSGPSSPQFIIYAPQFRKEESFEVIDVRKEEA